MVSPAAAKRRRKNTPSSIDRLDPEIRKLIADLRVDKGWTIDEIKAQLEKIGQGHVSRSALGRHVRSLADVTEELRESQVYAEALAKEAGNASQSQMLDLNGQLLQSQIFKLMLAEKDGAAIELAPKDVKALSEAMRNVALTRKTDFELIARAKAEAKEEATKEAAEKAVTAARSKGLSKDTVEAIRFAVLGSDS